MLKEEVECLKEISKDVNRCSKSKRESGSLIQFPNLRGQLDQDLGNYQNYPTDERAVHKLFC